MLYLTCSAVSCADVARRQMPMLTGNTGVEAVEAARSRFFAGSRKSSEVLVCSGHSVFLLGPIMAGLGVPDVCPSMTMSTEGSGLRFLIFGSHSHRSYRYDRGGQEDKEP